MGFLRNVYIYRISSALQIEQKRGGLVYCIFSEKVARTVHLDYENSTIQPAFSNEDVSLQIYVIKIEPASYVYSLQSKIHKSVSKCFWQPKGLIIRGWTATVESIGVVL